MLLRNYPYQLETELVKQKQLVLGACQSTGQDSNVAN